MEQPHEALVQPHPDGNTEAGAGGRKTKSFLRKKNESELKILKSVLYKHFLTDLENLILNYTYNEKPPADKDKYKAEFREAQLKARKPGDLSWNDLFEIELLISNLLPFARLSRHVWQLRMRYRDVVGLLQYEAYLSSKPPELAPTKVEEKDYKADIEYLLTEIYMRYMLMPENEKLRDNISRRITWIIIGGLAIIVVAAIIVSFQKVVVPLGPINLLLVLFIGAMGGLCSLQQRYQTTPRDGDPVDNVLILQQSWSRLFMPAISGAIFAALLYFIIIGGLVQGELFPEILAAKDKSNTGEEMLNAINSSMPISVSDYAKLVIWSFLAGFAERLVPDTLARFMATKEIGIKGIK